MFSAATKTKQVSSVANYIEDVFSTWLYTGNSTSGGSQTITNNIDLSGSGGLVWIKGRSAAAYNVLWDTARGAGTGSGSTVNKALTSNDTSPQGLGATSDYLSAFSSSGFTVTQGGAVTAYRDANYNNVTYVSWTFRKQAKFFDVVTYTGTGSNTTIAHNLGSVPGCILVKRTDSTFAWRVYHTSVGNGSYLNLGSTATSIANSAVWNSTTPTSTDFSVGTDTGVNASGGTYVAYLFANNSGGFGSAGTDNVVTCGSYTGNGSATGPSINLGYEPQWVMIKNSSASGSWQMIDAMRDMSVTGNAETLANTSAAETTTQYIAPNATGFSVVSTSSEVNTNTNTYIYIAIRRGPMKTPTDATKVFLPVAYSGTGAAQSITSASFPPDLAFNDSRTTGNGFGATMFDRLRGTTVYVRPGSQNNENTATDEITSFNMNGVSFGASSLGITNGSGINYVEWLFRRAPGFFDEVCYTGTGSATTVTHNLGVVPELIWVKNRTTNLLDWWSYNKTIGNTKYMVVNNNTAPVTSSTAWNNTTPTSSVFSVGTSTNVNNSGSNYVAYLFASCPGVSSVGTYTGTAATQTISCGFTGGARFVMVKRTDSTGDWWVWDSARGMVSGTDPRLGLDLTSNESNADWVLTTTGGFQVVTTNVAVNASGGTYIYLAIA